MKKIYALLFVLICFASVKAQTVTMGQGTTTTYTSCSMNILDNGGADGNYGNNRCDSLLIYSNSASTNCVQVDINLADFDIHPSDTLFIYDAPGRVDSMLLVALNNDLVANISSSVLSYAATIRNPTGALFLYFKTDGDSVGSGFYITTTCTAPCQRINVQFDTVLSNKYPVLNPEDGYFYLDLCPYDTLHLVAYGDYPDNYINYTQSDVTSIFDWDMGVDTAYGVGRHVLDYYFEPGRGYDVSLMIKDAHGCVSKIPQTFRIRTSENPIRKVLGMPDICTGQELNFTTGYDLISNVQVDTIGSQQATALSVNDTIFLPDGIACNGSCSYVSPVTFTAFAPSAKITSPNDILYVRINMEHSFVGDIYIRLTCPNNKFVALLKKMNAGTSSCSNQIPASEWGWIGSGSGGYFLGNPVDDLGGDCTPTTMGQCWNYCWSEATNQGYTYANSPHSFVYETNNVTNNKNIDSTNVALMTQVYHPEGSFNSLIGCPLNGTWSIEVMDGYSYDNGYICGWEMALDPHLVPADWSYNVVVDTTYLIGPGAQGSFVVPDTAGSIDYTIRVVDELGCHYDTNTVVNVTPAPKPDLGIDKEICEGEMIILDADTVGLNTVYHWNTGARTQTIPVITEGEYIVKVETSNADRTITCKGSDTVYVKVNPLPVFDVVPSDTMGCAPLLLKFENNTTPDEDVTYTWYISRMTESGLVYTNGSNLKSPSFELEEPGLYSVVLLATTKDGCTDSLMKWNYITVNAQPVAEFEADPAISLMSENDGLVHFINYSDSTVMRAQGTTFYWDFADGERDTESISPEHVYTQWGDYDVTLHIETEAGCSSEITHTVTVDADLEFPNVITPNADGINDVFAIQNLSTKINLEDPDGYRNNKLYVYDRWGNRVYFAENYDTFSRDGKIEKGTQIFDGTGLSDGVYYFSFYYKGKAKTVNYNGSLTIVR